MLRISTKGRYGMRLMLELALNYTQGPTLLKDIAKNQDISVGYLDHIIAPLKVAGLIISSRGAHGGYTLAKHPKNINAREIIEILEGKVSLVECTQPSSPCSRVSKCTTRYLWCEVNKSLLNTLESFVLEDLVNKSIEKKDNDLMYNI